jgi:hypothetical protein
MAGHDHTQVVHDHADSWHHHTSAEGRPQHEHASVANPHVLIHWFFLIVISGIVVIVSLLMYFGKMYNTTRQQRVETLQFYQENAWPRVRDAEAALGTDRPLSQFVFRAADRQAHTVQLPIEEAMKRVVARYQSSKTAQAPETTATQTKQ